MRLEISDASGRPLARADSMGGETFAQALWLAPGMRPRPLCGGMSLCGRCKVRFMSRAPKPCAEEEALFSEAELALGWRLACRHKIPDGEGIIEISLPDEEPCERPFKARLKAGAEKYFLGVDLGTTSIQWRAVQKDGRKLCEGSELNPQIAAGPDVISRLQYSSSGVRRDQLSDLVLDVLSRIVAELDRSGARAERLCVAANSVMTHILLKLGLGGLARAPYHLDFKGGEIISLPLSEGSLPCVAPPLPAPFCGGDISAGLLAVTAMGLEEPLLLADLGTNAELALLLPDKRLYLASAPLGPALEGIGPKCGGPAESGAAVSFTLGPQGLSPRFYDGKPGKRVSATGYISLLSHLLNLGLMDAGGHFTGRSLPLCRDVVKQNAEEGGRLKISGGIFLDASDVELLLKVKACFRLALSRLLAAAGEPGIKSLIFAGAIGDHAEPEALINLGFIPRQFGDRIILAGNASLNGACLLARDPSLLGGLKELCDSAVLIDLADDPSFLNDYLTEMTWQ